MATAFNNFGLVCMRGGRYYQAYTYLENALTLTLEFFRPTDLSVAIVKENLAEAYTYAGDDLGARRLFDESLAVFEQRCGPNCLRTAEALARYATALRYLDRGEEAERLETRARKIRRAADGIVGVSVDVKELDPKR
jgi:tetratricopeptide (TPR) repeat protein